MRIQEAETSDQRILSPINIRFSLDADFKGRNLDDPLRFSVPALLLVWFYRRRWRSVHITQESHWFPQSSSHWSTSVTRFEGIQLACGLNTRISTRI